MALAENRKIEKTHVFYGEEAAMKTLTETMSRVKKEAVTCSDSQSPSFSMTVEPVKQGFINFKKRGVKIRSITEITKENLHYCKELLQYVEMRHLDGIKGNFAVSETEYVATATVQEAKPVTQTIYSNAKAILEQQRYFFETLWNKAIPAEQKIREIEKGEIVEKTDIFYGVEKTIGVVQQAFANTKSIWYACGDNTAPSLIAGVDAIRQGYLDMKSRGILAKVIVDITAENIHYCKRIMEFAELRHLYSVKGNFGVNDTEYMAAATVQEEQMVPQLIYSNIKAVVEQQQYIFRTLWSRAMPAEQRIKEIEEGIEPIETKLLDDVGDISKRIVKTNETSREMSICSVTGGLRFVYQNFFEGFKTVAAKQAKGEHKGVRWVTTIDNKEDIDIVKIFLEMGVQIRHVKNTSPVNFAFSEKLFNATIEKMEGGRMIQNMLTSNEPLYISHFRSIFEELWKNGIDAKERMLEIELGIEPPKIEVIQSSRKSLELCKKLVKSAREEIILIFPTVNAVTRKEKAGILQFLLQAARDRPNQLKIRILMPKEKLIDQAVRSLNQLQNIEVRFIEQPTAASPKATFLVVDRKTSLMMELRDDSKTNFEEAVGLSIYSDSKAGVLSYVFIFDSLWRQTELYEQLQHYDKLQKEFINIAAHELRTPVQPILGMAEIIEGGFSDKDTAEITRNELDLIVRNARRLERLSSDVLEMARIEGNSVVLDKEKFDLQDVISAAIRDVKNQVDNDKVTLQYTSNSIQIHADRGKIAQVISNLLSNSTKFTREGIISVTAEQDNGSDDIIVKVSDTGIGIDNEIQSRLFTKFATKSHQGTGLGLYISKSLIEAHGGKIWAENNKDGVGATFYFTIPSSK